ncbi:class I SAM-dependent methyltransferase [Streptoalloteichus hindustanus]|uniref:Methyltransferase domain-containing protein n=1 Tax=Streptoalloteichus hindustanus TaxID=2017 RepID=A0A1M4VRR4_STRHI|nr:methyltransferase domain-containing protein [Streptoalloteichus hindustanus]SHE71555.1 Methyltransferase domain-containing protein [Streptoalloteichus hindustanus]
MDPTELRDRMYGPEDLATRDLFAGGFINFGYWASIPLDGPISVGQRITSQRRLYEVALDALGISPTTRLLEVGCGRGLGTALAASAYRARSADGVDIHPDQVARARRTNAAAIASSGGRLAYHQGAANALPFPDASFERVLSVEAAQHFDDIPGFAREVYRVLVPGGRLLVTTFFATGEAHATELASLIHTMDTGVDHARSVGLVARELAAAGFSEVSSRSIGEHVWPGWDRWLAQTEAATNWTRNWLTAYRLGLLDYYVLVAQRTA